MKKHKITQEELNIINEEHFEQYPEDRLLKWAGCNYNINQGNNEHEPLGTAQSMHDCLECERFDYCKVKMDTPTWFWDEEIEEQINDLWKSMFN